MQLDKLTIHRATQDDAAYCVRLMKRSTDYLGFLPKDALKEHIDYNHVLIAKYDGSPLGYAVHGAPAKKLWSATRIFQLAVEPIIWRNTIGTHLVRRIAEQAHRTCTATLSLRCRDGIPANAFWQALGFKMEHLELGGLRRRKLIIHWRIPVHQALPSSPADTTNTAPDGH